MSREDNLMGLLQKSYAFKENTFLKQVERTAKRDAYALVCVQMAHADYTKEDVLNYLKIKRDSHTVYLDKLPLEYDYATQTLVSKRSYTVTVSDDGINEISEGDKK